MRCGLTTRKTSVKRKNRKNWRFRAILEVFLTNNSHFYKDNKIYVSYCKLKKVAPHVHKRNEKNAEIIHNIIV